jgi:hypothetical protein
MNRKGSGSKWFLPNIRYCPNICLADLREITKNHCQGSLCPSRDYEERNVYCKSRQKPAVYWMALAIGMIIFQIQMYHKGMGCENVD